MASPKSPHQNHVNIHNFFPPHPPPPAAASAPPSSAATTVSFFPYQHANVHPQTLLPYHASPPLHANAGNQILALINSSNNNVKRHASAAFCSKVAKGRTLSGDYVSYDVDERIEGDREPQQLEVTPITKYGSDPELVIGRQIAVNKHYICYGLKAGNIRVLNLNTASRSLFRGHTKRVTDMAFFSDDVHVLASVSVDGRVYVWKICEGPDEEDKPQITGNLVTAIQFFEEGKTEYVHPRICWHCSNQDVLVAGIGNSVLRIDTTKVGEGEAYSAEAPLPCSTDGITKGVYLFGKHDGQVTDLSMCHWKTTTRLVSASSDGTIKIWEDRQAVPLAVLIPYSGQPVNSATLFTSPHHAEHVILVTAGPLNREVKIWAPVSEEGLPQPDHAELWKCTQTLELKSSAEPRVEEAFFNQVVALSQAGVLLIANAKKNAIYAPHIEYGATPNTSRMDYIAEFTVTMPILSFTGTFDPREDHTIKVYCVQTLAIQQYALDLCQCLPPAIDNLGLENTGSTVSCGPDNAERFPALDLNGAKYSGFTFPGSASKPTTSAGSSETSASMRYPVRSTSLDVAASREFMTSNMETGPVSLARTSDAGFISVASPPPPLSPRLLRKLSGTRDATPSSELLSNLSDVHTFDNAAKNDEKEVTSTAVSRVISSPVMFKHSTHLVTPSEILMAVSPSETTNFAESKNDKEVSIQDVVVNKEVGNAEAEVKVVGETQGVTDELGFHGEPQNNILGNREKFFCSQASDLGIQTTREYRRISAENDVVEEAQAISGNGVSHRLTQLRPASEAEVQGMDESVGPSAMRQKQKEGTSRASGQFSPSPNVLNIDSSSSVPEAVLSQVQTMQETLNQLMAMQKDWQNVVSSIVTFAVTREGRRQEAALSCDFEKLLKANNDALWAHFQEESAKNDKLLRGRLQQITSSVSNLINKDLATLLEKMVKKEMAAILPAAVRTITPTIEKAASSAILESFQRYVGDKAINQLERSVNSRLEATVGRQIQTQFQTSGKQALQDALKSSFEASMIPAFEKSCKVMFDQVDATFQRGMIEHTTAAQQHIDSIHSQLALALRDSINSVSSMAQTLSGQLADSQRNLLNLAAAGANPSTVNPLLSQLSGAPLHLLLEKVEAPMDPAKELSRLISERKYEEAFTTALQRSDVSIVSWLCSQVDLHGILSMVPIPLTQGVLLSLLQQLACDIHNDTPRKLAWLTDVAAAINPADHMIAVHVRPIFEQVFQRLNHHRTSPSISGSELSSIRLLIHVINSMLMTCK